MTNIAQFVLVVVITVLTFLLVIIGFQTFHVLHDLRQVIKKVSRMLDEDVPPNKAQKFDTKLTTSYPKASRTLRRFFRRRQA